MKNAKTIGAQQLAAAAQQKREVEEKLKAGENPKVVPQVDPLGPIEPAKPLKSEVRKYQFPSAPSSFKFPWEKQRTIVPDGVYSCPVSDSQKIEHLEQMVQARIISPYIEYPDVPVHLTPPPPTQTLVS